MEQSWWQSWLSALNCEYLRTELRQLRSDGGNGVLALGGDREADAAEAEHVRTGLRVREELRTVRRG